MNMVSACPHCGNQLWEILLDDPQSIVDRCPECKRTIPANVVSDSDINNQNIDAYLSHHFEEINKVTGSSDPATWQNGLSAYFPSFENPLPIDIAPFEQGDLQVELDLIADKERPKPDGNNFSEIEREEAHRRMLKSYGYSMGVDSQGLRITSSASHFKKSSTNLSPHDIVRLASEMEGGAVSLDERIQCPNCSAIVLPTDKKCQWCSTPLD